MHESGENYLETILLLHKKKGSVRSIDVATELGYSKPSISRAMGILKENGYITIDNTGNISFTEEGRIMAENIYERHRIISSFLKNTLKVSDEIADADACRIEHVISKETVEKMKEFMD